jgi:hypothetical protein
MGELYPVDSVKAVKINDGSAMISEQYKYDYI